MVTVLTETGDHELAGGKPSTQALWCSAKDALQATGWAAKPEGLCKGDVCVPLPAGREREFVGDGQINLAALWRHLGRPAVRSERGDVWVLSESARERQAALASLEAPDFTLPDPTGRMHRLSDYRGKKVFLVTWASW
jgi:AhpC/TSA family